MKPVSRTTSRVRVTEKKDLGPMLRAANLSRDEELVLRMRHGISEPGTTVLEFRGQAIPEIAAKLALMEMSVLDELAGREPTPAELEEAATKARIIERLKRL